MGEIFLGQSVGAEGFQKRVAIKRIYPDLAGDSRHREMFVREAKLVARMTHPNVAQVFELAEDKDDLYIVMEFVDGADLSRVIKLLRARSEHLSAPVVAIIVFDALNALDHAHRLTDEMGRPLGIVHRDISPHNLLLTPDGFVKLCDFGVARVAEGTGTRIGVAHGKLSYIAPEQFLGGAVDPRADLFALAAVTYEMLTASKLFRPQGEPEVLELMEQGIANPLETKPLTDCPPLLVEALRPALFLDAKKRYQTAAAFRENLEHYLSATDPLGARHALASLVRELRPDYESPTQETTTEDVSTNALDGKLKPSPHWTRVLEQVQPVTTVVDATVAMKRPRRPTVVRRGIMAAAVVVIGTLAGLSIVAPWSPIRAWLSSPRSTEPATVDPPSPSPGETTSDTPSLHPPPADGSTARRLRRKDTPRTGTTREDAGFLSLNSRPWARVFVDGVAIGRTTPLLSFPLAPGPHRVRLEGPRGETHVLKIHIRPHETITRFVKLK